MKRLVGQTDGEGAQDVSESSRKKAKTRRISSGGGGGRRGDGDDDGDDDEQVSAGNLDLNATPLGFDLNAPVVEEEEEELLSQGGSVSPSPFEAEVQSKLDDGDDSETTETKQPTAAAAVAAKSEEASPPAPPLSLPPPIMPKIEAVVDSSAQSGHAVKFEDDEESHQYSHSIGGGGDVVAAGTTPELSGIKEEEEEEEGSNQADTLSIVKEEHLEEEVEEEKPPVAIPAVFRQRFDPTTVPTIDEDLDIIRSVWNAWQQEDADALDMTLADALEEVAKHPLSPNRYCYLSCMYVSKKLPEAFSLPRTCKILLSFLDSTRAQPVVKRQLILPILACKLLFRAFAAEPDWPLEFVQVYLLDSVGSCSWVEDEGCKDFVTNLRTAFPDADLDVPMGSEDAKPPDPQVAAGDTTSSQTVKSEAQGIAVVKNRYPREEVRQKVRAEFLQSLTQLLGAAATKDNPHPLLRLLMRGAGFEEVRVVGSSMLEGWLNNPAHLRAAKDLLDRILQHTRGTSENDFNTVANLLALRVTSLQAPGQIKTLNNIFSDLIAQLVQRRSEYATLALKTFVTAELQSKHPHNIKSIITVLRAMSSESTPPEQELALILQELAASDEYQGLLRDFVCRLMKQAGTEFDVHQLCLGLMQPWQLMAEQEETLKVAWLNQLVELTTQLLLHAAAPFVADKTLFAAITLSLEPGSNAPGASVAPGSGLERSSSGAPFKDRLSQLEKFSLDTQNFQTVSMEWCTDVLAVYLPNISGAHFKQVVCELLFMEEPEVYFPHGDGADEVEINYIQLLGACTRAPEEIVARLFLMGISNFPMSQEEALDTIELLVWRAAKLEKHMENSLTATSVQLPAAIFKLASLNLPGFLQQSVMQLVLKDMYWRAALVVLIVAVFNPGTIGRFVWESLPFVRCLMEALMTGSRNFLPTSANEATKAEFIKMEADAEQMDKQAEEAISVFLAEKRRTESPGVDVDANLLPEWKGKVMLLNQAGPVRQPPQSVYDQLDHFDNAYQLGKLLRKCRDPDFFSEVTGIQTLQQAWPWLQKIVVREPEVVACLPPAWQCELLYMHEGVQPTGRKLSLDLVKLRSNLHQVVTEMEPSREGEVEAIVGFLSRKLAATKSAVRSRARRCFAGLFSPSLQTSETPAASHPSSPRDSKRPDNTPGGLGRWPGGSSSTDTTVPVHTRKSAGTTTTSYSSTHLSPGVSPGVNHTVIHTDNHRDRMRAGYPSAGAEDDTSWLHLVEKLPTGPRLISAVLPAVWLALQQETSIRVVIAYLNFLKKHSPTLPSWRSLACGLAVFVTQRRMLTSSLLSAPLAALPNTFDANTVKPDHRAGIVDLILGSLCEALEVGTVADAGFEELTPSASPFVTFVSPQYRNNEHVVQRVSLHKVMVDAALEVISQLACEEGLGSREKPGFLRLLNLLFPDAIGSVAWLEGRDGLKLPLLSEVQANVFARSKVPRLITAGLAALSLGAKLDLCENFGLSSAAITALLQELDAVSLASLEPMLGARGLFSRRRAKKLQNCVSTLMQPGSPCGVRFLSNLEVLAAGSEPTEQQAQQVVPPLGLGEAEDVARMDTDEPNSDLGNQLSYQVYQWLSPWVDEEATGSNDAAYHSTGIGDHAAAYVAFRQRLHQTLLCGVKSGLWFDMTQHVDICLELSRKGDGSILNKNFISLGLPILFLFTQFRIGKSQQDLDDLVTLIHHGVDFTMKRASSEESQSLLARVSYILGKFLQPVGRQSLENVSVEGEKVSITGVDLFVLKNLVEVPLHSFELQLRSALRQRLKPLWGQLNTSSQGDQTQDVEVKLLGTMTSKVLMEMVELLRAWRCKHDSIQPVDLRGQVQWTGYCALIFEFLAYLDPEFVSAPHFNSLFEEHPRPWRRMRESFSVPNLALRWIIHRSSWSSISRTLQGLLSACLEGEEGEGTLEKLEHKDIFQMQHSTFQVLSEADLVLEFVTVCMRHPRSVLGCRLDDDLEHFKPETNMVFFSVNATSAHAASMLAVADMMAFGAINSSAELDVNESLRPATTAQSLSSPYQAMKVLMAFACQGSHILSTIIQQLYDWEQGRNVDVFLPYDLRAAKKEMVVRAAVSAAAADLLGSLYLAFPVSVGAILQAKTDQKLLLQGPMPLTIERAGMKNRSGQTCALSGVLHHALRSICNGSEKEAKSAYGFCHDMTRQHPTLVIPHLPTLSVLLKELLPLVKQGESQVRSTVARAFSLGIGLLDALWPHLLINHQTNAADSTEQSFLESILSFYFKFLECLTVPDRPIFAKVVARLADFLCHCVAAGGRYRDFVIAHQAILRATTQIFGKIKKLGFLLGMLDKLSVTPSVPNSLLGLPDGTALMVGGSLGPPSFHLEDVLKVRSQLLQCISWQGPAVWKDSKYDLYGTGLKSYRFPYYFMEEDAEEVNLNATLTDLERASARMPAILSVLEDSLLELTQINDSDMRDRAYILLERLLLHCPSERSAANIAQGLIQQLSSSNVSLAKTAAHQVSRFFYYCAEYQETLLVEMLQMGRSATDDLQQLLQGLFTVVGGSSA